MSTPRDPQNLTLLVLGAGPKALAIAAKRQALAKLGYTVPKLIIIDKQGVAANWTGKHGFTHGKQSLGTSPEKDVGFPYNHTIHLHPRSIAVNGHLSQPQPPPTSIPELPRLMMANYSYTAYLIDSGKHTEYVDRGKPHPSHREWSRYLEWVAHRAGVLEDPTGTAECRLIKANATRIHWFEDRAISRAMWKVVLQDSVIDEGSVDGDGLVMTGPGLPRPLSGEDDLPTEKPVFTGHKAPPRLLNGASFWEPRYLNLLPAFLRDNHRVAILGTGETAASVFLALRERVPARTEVDIISPQGIPFSRGESFWENQIYSDPKRWSDFSKSRRAAIIERTDRGVISPDALARMSSDDHLEFLPGYISRVFVNPSVPWRNDLPLCVEIVQSDPRLGVPSDPPRRRVYALIINCTGFDPLWFSRHDWLGEDARNATNLLRATTPADVQDRIAFDLSLGDWPKLHLPMVAGLAQGPGFPNLSCLGLLSDRILSSYVR